MWSVSTDVVVRIIESDCDGLCPSVLAFYLSAVEMPIRVPRITPEKWGPFHNLKNYGILWNFMELYELLWNFMLFFAFFFESRL
jgi:hypothetical protein